MSQQTTTTTTTSPTTPPPSLSSSSSSTHHQRTLQLISDHSKTGESFFLRENYREAAEHFRLALTQIATASSHGDNEDEHDDAWITTSVMKHEMILLNNLALALLFDHHVESSSGDHDDFTTSNSSSSNSTLQQQRLKMEQLLLQSFEVGQQLVMLQRQLQLQRQQQADQYSFTKPMNHLGYMYLELDFDLMNAEKCFLRSVSVCPNDFSAWIGLAQVYLNRSEFNDALRCCYRAKQIQSNNVHVLLVCASIKLKMGWPAEAYTILTHAKKVAPHNSSVHTSWGNFYYGQSMYPQSYESYERAWKDDPMCKVAIDGMIDILLKTQQYAKANRLMMQSRFSTFHSHRVKKSVLSMCGFYQAFEEQENEEDQITATTLNRTVSGERCISYMFRASIVNENNRAFYDWQQGNASAALSRLLFFHNIPEKLLMQDSLLNSDCLNELANKSPETLHMLWLLCVHVRSPTTGVIMLKKLYQLERVHALCRPCNFKNMFWYRVACAETGSPWKLLKYSKWLYEVNKRDNFSFVLQVFAFNRMNRRSQPLDTKTSSHLMACLEQSRSSSESQMMLHEEIQFLIRQGDYSAAEKLFPSKYSQSTWPFTLLMLYARLLYKKKTMITSRQALQIVNNHLKKYQRTDECLLLRLKLLFNMAEMNNFEGYYSDYEPKTFESSWRKLKIGCKFYLSICHFSKVSELLKLLKNMYNVRIKKWKYDNELSNKHDDILILEEYADSYYLLKAKFYLTKKEPRIALNKLNKISEHMDKTRAMIPLLQAIHRVNGYRIALEKAQLFLESTPQSYHSQLWREIMIICLDNDLTRQAQTIQTRVGSSRFPRIDMLLPYMKIAFLSNAFDSLEAYINRIDFNFLIYQARKRTDAKNLLAQVQLYRLTVNIRKVKYMFETKKESDLVALYNDISLLVADAKLFKDDVVAAYNSREVFGEEFKRKIFDLFSAYAHVMGNIFTLNSRVRSYNSTFKLIEARPLNVEYKALSDEIYDFYLGLLYLADNSISNYGLFKTYCERILAMSANPNECVDFTHTLILHAYLNDDIKLVNKLARSRKGGDVTFLNFMKSLIRYTEHPHSLVDIQKDLYQTTLVYMMNNYFMFTEANWRALLHVYELMPPTNLNSDDLMTVRSFLRYNCELCTKEAFSAGSKDIFGIIQTLRNQTLDYSSYVSLLQQAWDLSDHWYFRSLLLKIHLDKHQYFRDIRPKVGTSIWFLEHHDSCAIISEVVNSCMIPVQISLENDVQVIPFERFAHNISLSTQYLREYVDSTEGKSALIWKAIFYIYYESHLDNAQKDFITRLKSLCRCFMPHFTSSNSMKTCLTNFNMMIHDIDLRYSDSIAMRHAFVLKKTHGEFDAQFARLLCDTIREFFNHGDAPEKLLERTCLYLLSRCTHDKVPPHTDSFNLASIFLSKRSLTTQPNRDHYIRRLLDVRFNPRESDLIHNSDWSIWYWFLVHLSLPDNKGDRDMELFCLSVYGLFNSLICLFSPHQKAAFEIHQRINEPFLPTAMVGTNIDNRDYLHNLESSSTTDFVALLGMMFSCEAVCSNSSIRRVQPVAGKAKDQSYQISTPIALPETALSIRAARAYFPILLDMVHDLVNMFFFWGSDAEHRSKCLLKFKELLLILCGLFELRLITINQVADVELLLNVLAKSITACFYYDFFTETDRDVVLDSIVKLRVGQRCILSDLQFLLHLIYNTPSAVLLDTILQTPIFVRELSSDIRSIVSSYHSLMFDPTNISNDKMKDHLIRMLKQEFVNLTELEIVLAGENLRITLYSSERVIGILTEAMPDEMNAETAGQFLLNSTCLTVGSSQRDFTTSLQQKRFLVFGALSLYLEEPTSVTIEHALRSSEEESKGSFLQKDISNLFYDLGRKSALVQYREQNERTPVLGPDKYIFDQSWYDNMDCVVKQIAQMSAIGWVCGLWNRRANNIYLTLDPEHPSIHHRALGFILESGISSIDELGERAGVLSPFRMNVSDIQAIVRLTPNSYDIFHSELEKCLFSFTEDPIASQHILTSIKRMTLLNSTLVSLTTRGAQNNSLVVYTQYGLDHKMDQTTLMSSPRTASGVQSSIDDESESQLVRIEKENPLSVGDSLFYQLMKRRIRLQDYLEKQKAQQFAFLTKNEQDVSSLDEDETAVTDTQETTQESAENKIGAKFISTNELITRYQVDVVERAVLRLQKFVCISSHNMSGMKQCSSVSQLATVLIEQAIQHPA